MENEWAGELYVAGLLARALLAMRDRIELRIADTLLKNIQR
jgi:hypothetical protein